MISTWLKCIHILSGYAVCGKEPVPITLLLGATILRELRENACRPARFSKLANWSCEKRKQKGTDSSFDVAECITERKPYPLRLGPSGYEVFHLASNFIK